MPANVFDVFMSQHEPVGSLVNHANQVLWDDSALHPVVKERLRIATAQAIGCSYCERFRTEIDGRPVLDEDLSGREDQAVFAERFAVEVVRERGAVPDELTMEAERRFSAAEYADLIFSIGWFIGMQHVGRMMHWDNACPVAAIRELVEAGEAA